MDSGVTDYRQRKIVDFGRRHENTFRKRKSLLRMKVPDQSLELFHIIISMGISNVICATIHGV